MNRAKNLKTQTKQHKKVITSKAKTSKKTKTAKSNRKPQQNTIKQIHKNQKPHWYTQYPWSPVPDVVENFVGRELEFMGFWYEMAKLVGRGPGKKSNYAFIGQRKLGKTAYLKRCYNIAFWEQDEVVPFYYSFSQNDGYRENIIQISDLRRTMPLKFLQQFFAFCTKDKAFLEKKFTEDVFQYAEKIKFPNLQHITRSFEASLELINSTTGPSTLQYIWEITQDLSFLADKKCFLIIDEAQEMDISLYEGDVRRQCKASISDIIQKDHSLVFVSGSNVSMLVNNFLDYSTANRFAKREFTPLKPKDAKELINKTCFDGYENVADDLFKLVGGNPYYIEKVLSFNMNYFDAYDGEKDFSSKEGLQKAYDFEVFHFKGFIYDFWNVHIRKNKDDLNNDPQGKKGLALQLLYKISKNPEREFTYSELMDEFAVDEDTLVKKIEQLEHADLIIPTGLTRLTYAFPDVVLPVFINNFYHHLIVEGPSKNISKIAQQDYEEMINTFKKTISEGHISLERAKKDIVYIENKVVELNFERIKINSKVKSALGKLSLCKGIKRENATKRKVRDMIRNNEGMFKNYDLEGVVSSINIRESKGTGCEIDVYVELKTKGKKQKKITFLAEVKDRIKKVSMDEAEKFLATVKKAIHDFSLKEVKAVYISTSGFENDEVKDYLENNKVTCAFSEAVFEV